jgi:hypothetical protein
MEREAKTGWGDTPVAVVGRQIQRLNFPALWHRKIWPKVFARPRLGFRFPRAGMDFTGRRQHFI